MDENGASSPGGFSLELLQYFPASFCIDWPCEGDEDRAYLELRAQIGYFSHDISGVASTAHENDSSIAPIVLNNPMSTF